MNEQLHQAAVMDEAGKMVMRSGQQQEHDWALEAGIAKGIAGASFGAATAVSLQEENARIRAQNEANWRAAMPMYMQVSSNASSCRSNAAFIQKNIEALKEKLVSDASTTDVMNLLKITDPTVEVSETGAYRITASVEAKDALFVFGDVPAVANGTIEAHVLNGGNEIGTAKMVLPLNGVSNKVGIIGMGLSGAEEGKSYEVTFTGYKLWLMEK